MLFFGGTTAEGQTERGAEFRDILEGTEKRVPDCSPSVGAGESAGGVSTLGYRFILKIELEAGKTIGLGSTNDRASR